MSLERGRKDLSNDISHDQMQGMGTRLQRIETDRVWIRGVPSALGVMDGRRDGATDVGKLGLR